jgi:hypothetical protein
MELTLDCAVVERTKDELETWNRVNAPLSKISGHGSGISAAMRFQQTGVVS